MSVLWSAVSGQRVQGARLPLVRLDERGRNPGCLISRRKNPRMVRVVEDSQVNVPLGE